MSDRLGPAPAASDKGGAVVGGLSRGARRAAWLSVAGLLFIVLPLGLAVRAGWQPLLDLDKSVSDTLVVPGRGTDVDVLRLLTTAGSFFGRVVVIVPLAIWFALLRRWQLLVFVIVAAIGISPLNGFLKVVFDRDRPVYDDTIRIGGLSFPSGHASGAAALAAMLVVLAWPVLAGRWRVAWVTLAAATVLTVGYTRIALGAHFLSDVVAGWTVGITWVLLLAVLLGVWPAQPGALRPRGSAAQS